jgi:hypothetical protein
MTVPASTLSIISLFSTKSCTSSSKVKYGIDILPSWVDCKKNRDLLTRWKRKSLLHAHLTRLNSQVSNTYYSEYVIKLLTKRQLLSWWKCQRWKMDKRGWGSKRSLVVSTKRCYVVWTINSLHKVARIVLLRGGVWCIIPPKWETEHYPCWTDAWSSMPCCHDASCWQLRSFLHENVIACIRIDMGMPHKGKLSANYMWRKTLVEHPALTKPAKAINNEDYCVDSLMYKNIMDWNKCAGEFVVENGISKAKWGLIRKLSVAIFVLFCTDSIHIIGLFSFQMVPRVWWLLSTKMTLIGPKYMTRPTMSSQHFARRVVLPPDGASMNRSLNQGSKGGNSGKEDQLVE